MGHCFGACYSGVLEEFQISANQILPFLVHNTENRASVWIAPPTFFNFLQKSMLWAFKWAKNHQIWLCGSGDRIFKLFLHVLQQHTYSHGIYISFAYQPIAENFELQHSLFIFFLERTHCGLSNEPSMTKNGLVVQEIQFLKVFALNQLTALYYIRNYR